MSASSLIIVFFCKAQQKIYSLQVPLPELLQLRGRVGGDHRAPWAVAERPRLAAREVDGHGQARVERGVDPGGGGGGRQGASRVPEGGIRGVVLTNVRDLRKQKYI